jgi:hypothetical protein
MEGEKFWQGEPITNKDNFGRLITDQFIDGATLAGPWAIMSPASYSAHGVGLGTGRGQKYQRTGDGRWKKIEG